MTMHRLLIIAMLTALSCTPAAPEGATQSKSAKPTQSAGPRPSTEAKPPPAPPVVREDSETLVFSWFDPERGHVTGTKVAEIPQGSRQNVVVADLSRTPEQRQSARYVMIADLSQKKPDGSYTVVVQSRYRFNDADVTDLGPIPKNNGVIVYSTSWCGPCKAVKAWLKSEGIPFVSKDIEEEPAAAAEMSAKLKKAGMQAGGVPVIDVAGTMIHGFNQPAIERALQAMN